MSQIHVDTHQTCLQSGRSCGYLLLLVEILNVSVRHPDVEVIFTIAPME